MQGTYSPTLRLVYSLDGPPSPAVVAAARGALQLAALLAVHCAAACGARGVASACGLFPRPASTPRAGAAEAPHEGAAAGRPPAAPLEEPLLPKDRQTGAQAEAPHPAGASEGPPSDSRQQPPAEVVVEEGPCPPPPLPLGLPPAVMATLELG